MDNGQSQPEFVFKKSFYIGESFLIFNQGIIIRVNVIDLSNRIESNDTSVNCLLH